MAVSTSYRELLLANVLIDLKTITTANSFRTNMASDNISRMLKSPDEMKNDDFPALFVSDGVENIEYGTNKELKSLFNIIIYGYVRFNTKASVSEIASTQLNKLISDVKEVLMDTDKTLWGTAGVVFVRLVQVETDEGVMEPEAVFRLQTEIEYYTVSSDMGASV